MMDVSDTLFSSLNPLPMFNTPCDLCMYMYYV